MNSRLKLIFVVVAVAVALGTAYALFSGADPKSPSEGNSASLSRTSGDTLASPQDPEDGTLEMTPADRQARGIETALVKRRPLDEEVTVPGEVTLDQYRSVQISPRISAQIVARHARLGDKVDRGQPLITLSSVGMAEAQGDLIVTNREWKRVRKLGRDVVSGRRYVEAQVAAQQAKAKVLAFGMTPEQIIALVAKNDAAKATGTFDLLAPRGGTVIEDNFIVGEIVEPGRILFQISDETRVWIEAQLAPEQATHVAAGTAAQVLIDAQRQLSGRVVQVHHRLDQTTRTLAVRVEVQNVADELHPGQFVNVRIEVGESAPVLAVPTSAVTLMDGSPTVFKVDGDKIAPSTVRTGPTRGAWFEITDGLVDGDQVVVSGVFVLKSLILKSKMGEGD